AMGSVIVMTNVLDLPAGLANAGDETAQSELAEANTAEPELAQIRTRAAAALTAIVLPHRELRRPLRLLDHCLTRHVLFPPRGRLSATFISTKRQPQLFQQSQRTVIAP